MKSMWLTNPLFLSRIFIFLAHFAHSTFNQDRLMAIARDEVPALPFIGLSFENHSSDCVIPSESFSTPITDECNFFR